MVVIQFISSNIVGVGVIYLVVGGKIKMSEFLPLQMPVSTSAEYLVCFVFFL